MTSRGALDRATLTLGVAGLVSLVFAVLGGSFGFLDFSASAIAVTVVFGGLACAAGWLTNRVMAAIAAVGFLLAAAMLLVFLGVGGGFLHGDGSTIALWLGLGVGLGVLAATPRIP